MNLNSVLFNILPDIKPPLYSLAFVLKAFYIFSPISTSLSYEITIETPLTSKIETPPSKILQGR